MYLLKLYIYNPMSMCNIYLWDILIVSAVLTLCNIVLPIATQLVQEYIHIVSNTTMIKVATTML